VKEAAAFVDSLTPEHVRDFALSRRITFAVDNREVVLTDEEVEVSRQEKDGFAVESDGALSVVLVTDLTRELIDEGFARELVSKIQNMRKATGLEVTDHILVTLRTSERVEQAARGYDEFIRHETLAEKLLFVDKPESGNAKEWDINGERTAISVAKV